MSTTRAPHHADALARGTCDHAGLLERRQDGAFTCSYCGATYVEQDYIYEALARVEKAFEVYDRLDAALKALGPIERFFERLNSMDQALGRIETGQAPITGMARRVNEAADEMGGVIGPMIDAVYDSPVAAMLGLGEKPQIPGRIISEG